MGYEYIKMNGMEKYIYMVEGKYIYMYVEIYYICFII